MSMDRRSLPSLQFAGPFLIIALLCAGCSVTKVARLYPGPEQTEEKIAIVRGEDDFNGAVFIEKVDGVALNEGEFRYFSPAFGPPRVIEVHVLPGPHVIEVSWLRGWGRSISNATVAIDVEAGRRYEVWADNIPPDSRLKRVGLAVFGGRSSWTAWVVDAASKQIVAGHPPGEARPDYTPPPTLTPGPLPKEKLRDE